VLVAVVRRGLNNDSS